MGKTEAMRDSFDSHAEDWSRLLNSFNGRLRHAEMMHHVRAHLPNRRLRVLDAGGGSGEVAADLARDGHRVTLLDFSWAMLERARLRCEGLEVAIVQCDVSNLDALLEPESFDVALCHSLLEFVENPPTVLAQLGRALPGGGLLSVKVGNRYHAPLRKALLEREFDGARQGLESEVPAADLFGLPRRTFYPEEIARAILQCRFRIVGEYGVRVFSDLLPRPPQDMEQLLRLELAAAALPAYRYMARFIQFIAVKEQ